MIRRIASLAVPLSAAFLAIMALLLNAPALFYMATAFIMILIACQVQARLAVRGLHFDRIAPESARIGDLITVEIIVWSEIKIRRPFITIEDDLTTKLMVAQRSPSLPIAPAFDIPIRTQYQFRARRRGKFKWAGLTVIGADALGLITKSKHYDTSQTQITILPRPIPVALELPAAAGWGISENEAGSNRGAGIDPWGIRKYAHGDSLRHVHWRSSAKAGQLLVKEFEAGTHASAAFILQRTTGTDIGPEGQSSLDLMCGHAVFLAENFLRQGMQVTFPALERDPSPGMGQERISEIYDLLAAIQADQPALVGDELISLSLDLAPGSVVFVMIGTEDKTLLTAVSTLLKKGTRLVPLVYDAFSMAKKPLAKGRTAATPSFMEELQSLGAVPVVMPIEAPSEVIHLQG